MIWMDSVQANICYSNDSENSMGRIFREGFLGENITTCVEEFKKMVLL